MSHQKYAPKKKNDVVHFYFIEHPFVGISLQTRPINFSGKIPQFFFFKKNTQLQSPFSKKRLFGALLAEKNLHKYEKHIEIQRFLEHYQNQQKFN